MDFWNYFKKISASEKFTEEKLVLGVIKSTYLPSDRANTSIASINDLAKMIKLGEILYEKNEVGKRYIFAYNLTYDLFASVYSVSKEVGVFFRMALPLDKNEVGTIKKLYRRLADRSIEARLIGMQNKQKNASDIVKSLLFLSNLSNSALVEVDLFGNEVRHVAIDLKTGLSYDVLLGNILYRPGELVNHLDFDEFSKGAVRLKLV